MIKVFCLKYSARPFFVPSDQKKVGNDYSIYQIDSTERGQVEVKKWECF